MAVADSKKKTPLIRLEIVKAAAWGIVATLILAVLIVVGSRNLSHFDAVLARIIHEQANKEAIGTVELC